MFLTVLLHSVHSIHPSKMSVRAPCTTACISHSTLITHTAGYLMHSSLSFIHHCSSLSSQNVHHVYVVVVCSYHECRQLSSLLSNPLILSIHSLILAFWQHPQWNESLVQTGCAYQCIPAVCSTHSRIQYMDNEGYKGVQIQHSQLLEIDLLLLINQSLPNSVGPVDLSV